MVRHLVSYFGNRYLDHFQRDLEEVVDHGFNGIVHCATEADVEWSLGRLTEIFEATRAAGLECWADPWGVGGVFGGEAHSGFLGRNPDALQRSSRGGMLPHACLRNPSFVRFMKEWIDGVAEAGAETIFWDEPHVGMTGSDAWACACDICREAFADEVPHEVTDQVLDFRVATALEFVDQMSRHARSKGLRNSVCLYPLDPVRARSLGLPPLVDIARLEAVDDVGVDPYPLFVPVPLSEFDPEKFVGGWAEKLVKVAEDSGVTVHLWIQGFLIPDGFEELVVRCAEVARKHGVSDLAFWGYRAAEATSKIAPTSPQLVWDAAGRAFSPRSLLE